MVTLELAFSPTRLLVVRIELPNMVAVQGLHDADPREHRRAVVFRDQDQRLDRSLPRRMVLVGFGQPCDVVRRSGLAIEERKKKGQCKYSRSGGGDYLSPVAATDGLLQ